MSSLVGVITRVAFQGKVTFLAAGTSVAAAIFVMARQSPAQRPPVAATACSVRVFEKRVQRTRLFRPDRPAACRRPQGVTGTTHPPGGAISLIAVIGGKRVYEMGFWYVLFPGTVGPLLLLFVAIVVNNLNPQRSYPLWWRPT